MASLESIFTSRRRLWLLMAVAGVTLLASWDSTVRLQSVVDSEDLGTELQGPRSLLARAEMRVLKNLPEFTGFRGGLSHATPSSFEAGDAAAASRSAAAGETSTAQIKRAALETSQESSQGAQVTLTAAAQKQEAKQAQASAVADKPKAAATTATAGAAAVAQPQAAAAAAATAMQQAQKEQQPAATAAAAAQATGQAAAAQGQGQCARVQRNQDCWGEVLVWGMTQKMDTAEQCCQACLKYKPESSKDMMDCNVWVYCEDEKLCGEHYKECWLKHKADPYGSNVAPRGPTVGWTTGVTAEPDPAPEDPVDPTDDRKYHVVVTAQGTAQHWQVRIGYYWYKKVKAQCEAAGNCQMGGFTRLLHSGQPDDLMDEIPTFVAQPLPPEHPSHGYVVLNRPYALQQWVQQVKIPEKYVLMSEPDHIWLKPMPNLMRGQRPAAFPFFYIEPWKYPGLVSKFLGPTNRAQAEKIAPIGNAPTLLSWADMQRLMPVFFNMSIAIHNEPESNKEWGWVQEMYAFTLACKKAGIDKIDLYRKMLAQPPFDSEVNEFYILHYTYANRFTADGQSVQEGTWVWEFDKRKFMDLAIGRNFPEPPANVNHDMVRHLIRAINEATDKIPGWDEFSKTGKVTQLWDGNL